MGQGRGQLAKLPENNMGYKGVLTVESDVNGKVIITENLTFTQTVGNPDPKIAAAKVVWEQILSIIAKLK